MPQRKTIFDNKKRLEELIRLLKSGYSYKSLGRYFACHHTSILFQARKLNLHTPSNKRVNLKGGGYALPKTYQKKSVFNPSVLIISDKLNIRETLNAGKHTYAEYLKEEADRKHGHDKTA